MAQSWRLLQSCGHALIAEEIGANAALETEDLDHGTLKPRGGLLRALALLGKDRLPTLVAKQTVNPKLSPIELDRLPFGSDRTK